MSFIVRAVKRLHWQDLRCEESDWEETWLEEKSPSLTQPHLGQSEISRTFPDIYS